VAESSSTDPAATASGNGAPAGKRDLDRAFEALYREHLRDVYSYCYYRIGNHHDAEDVTEQTFLQAYRHFERAQRESDGRPLRPWLIRIAHNLAANYHRDRSRRPTAALDNVEPVEHPHGTERIVEGRERMREVMSGLDRLSDDYRTVFLLKEVEGYDHAEIAELLGISTANSEVRLHRARRQLRDLLRGSR